MEKPWYRELFNRRQNLAQQDKAGESDADAHFHLGLIFSNIEGEGQDQVQAAQSYLKAANLNHPLAQFNLGLMYATGQGVARNDSEAVRWIRKAAEQGDAGAQFNLGTRCHRSSVSDVPMDSAESKIESYKWLQLAAAQGYNQAVAACERVTLTMSFEEVAEGQNRVAAFANSAQPAED
jgi:TPR repeat protein